MTLGVNVKIATPKNKSRLIKKWENLLKCHVTSQKLQLDAWGLLD